MRATGIDISRYQAPQDLAKPHGISFETMLNVVDFLFVRAGFGGSAGGAWTDPRVHGYMGDLEGLLLRNPKPFTFYWYFRDDVSVMDQVNRFSEVVNRYKEVVNLPLVVDAEAFVKSNLLSTQKIIDFQIEVENQTGLLVDILYGRAGQLNAETTPGLEVVLPYLFIARYAGLDPQTDEPWEEGGIQEYVEPRDYDEWSFWQYTEKGDQTKYGVTAGAIGIDEVVYNGTVEEVRSFAKLDQPNDPPIDFSQWGVAVVDMKVNEIAAGGTELFAFIQDVSHEPQVLTVQGAYGMRVTVELMLSGIAVVLRANQKIYSSSYSIYTFMRDFNIAKEDFVLVTVFNPIETAVASVKLVLERYGEL